MIWLTAVLVAAVALAIAAATVLREAARLTRMPPPPVYDAEEAYDWVVERLPDLVAATLTPDDVRRILVLQIDHFTRRGVSSAAVGADGDVVIGEAETVDYIVEEARRAGEEYLPEQVQPVVEIQLDYLRAIGALGGPA